MLPCLNSVKLTDIQFIIIYDQKKKKKKTFEKPEPGNVSYLRSVTMQIFYSSSLRQTYANKSPKKQWTARARARILGIFKVHLNRLKNAWTSRKTANLN